MEKLQKQREHLHEMLHPFPQEAGIVFVFIFVHLCICTTTQGEHLLELFHPFPQVVRQAAEAGINVCNSAGDQPNKLGVA